MLRDSVCISYLKLNENGNFFLPSLVTDHRGKSEATSELLESIAPLCVMVTLSSADATLVAPERERSYPTQNLLFPAHPWHLLKHRRGHSVSQLKEIIPFILQQRTVSIKQQTPPQRRIQSSEAYQDSLTESFSSAPSLQRAAETQVVAHHCHLCFIQSLEKRLQGFQLLN